MNRTMALTMALFAFLPYVFSTELEAQQIVVGSKNFAESRLLAEIMSQVIEIETGLHVERKMGLAGTQVCFEALRSGSIDIYPEYTGTGLVSILHEPAESEPILTFRRVRDSFQQRWNLHWFPPLGFENSYELAIPKDVSQEFEIHSISDMVPYSARWTAGFGYEFIQRADGYAGLKRFYGLEFARVRGMQQALKYQAAGKGLLDCLDVYTTDGRLMVHNLVVLQDDRNFFPPYEAAALVRGETLDRYPEISSALMRLSHSIREQDMRQMNYDVETQGEPIESVARRFLVTLGLLRSTPHTSAPVPTDSFWSYVWQQRHSLLKRTGEHLVLAGVAVSLAILLAIPLGLVLTFRRRTAETLLRIVATSQTIPSLALLAFMIPVLGVGAKPAIVALWIYAVFPILRNTYTGLLQADPAAVHAATALGMNPLQVLLQVQLPLAVPVIMAGIRTASVISIGTATLAAFVGAGGLGVPIISGVQSINATVILSGALPAALLAIGIDVLLGALENALRPRGTWDTHSVGRP